MCQIQFLEKNFVLHKLVLNDISCCPQAHGGAGLCNDFPLAAMYSWARVLRLADGPDEVHLKVAAKFEYMKANASKL